MCEDIDVEDYLARESDPERTMLALVGDLHRITVYPRPGFQTDQDVPVQIIDTLRCLAAGGYGRRPLDGGLDGSAL